MGTLDETVLLNEPINEPWNVGVPQMREDLNTLYAQLGRAYYEGRFEDPLPELLPLFDKITMLINERVQESICRACGKPLESNSIFCGSCGAKV